MTANSRSGESESAGGSAGEIRLNGKAHRLARVMTLRELVVAVGCDPEAVAVEVNGEIVRRARLAETEVAGGESVEIVRFVQGG